MTQMESPLSLDYCALVETSNDKERDGSASPELTRQESLNDSMLKAVLSLSGIALTPSYLFKCKDEELDLCH